MRASAGRRRGLPCGEHRVASGFPQVLRPSHAPEFYGRPVPPRPGTRTAVATNATAPITVIAQNVARHPTVRRRARRRGRRVRSPPSGRRTSSRPRGRTVREGPGGGRRGSRCRRTSRGRGPPRLCPAASPRTSGPAPTAGSCDEQRQQTYQQGLLGQGGRRRRHRCRAHRDRQGVAGDQPTRRSRGHVQVLAHLGSGPPITNSARPMPKPPSAGASRPNRPPASRSSAVRSPPRRSGASAPPRPRTSHSPSCRSRTCPSGRCTDRLRHPSPCSSAGPDRSNRPPPS